MACKRSKDEPSECNSFLQSSKRMGQVATHILTAESEVEIDFNTSKNKHKENSFKSIKQKEEKKSFFEEPPLPSLPLWEPPKLPDSDSNFLSVSASMDQVDDLPVTQKVFPSEMQSVLQVQPLLHSSSSFSLPSQKTGIDQINNFIRKANVEPNTVEGIQFIVNSMYRKLCGLETEMRSMRSILDTNHGNKENINIDYLPANSVEEFDSLENKIINSNDKDIICRKLKQIDGRNVSDFLKNALKTCLTDKLCCSINRIGADKKRRLIGPVESLIFDAAYCLFPTATEFSMTTIIAKHLKKSKDRYFAAKKRSSSLTSDIQIHSPVRKKRNLNTDSCSDSS
ncbi:uncharacterized protein LOC124813139 isoform X1 [Hydra vulgaris]|uniref:uncharacterized protein LOC124813139 isoform X1 n=1 Tax=Hydra vulgaris TaxID=6087 RepID=UPI0032EA6FB8